jgi:hypothetical protein
MPPLSPLALQPYISVKFKKNWSRSMAGRPLRKRILAEIKDKGGADYLFEEIASGKTMTQLAKDYGCNRQYFSTSINTIPEYANALAKARQEAADALVEQGLDMVDDLDGGSTNSEIAATREKVQWRKFMAGSYNQERYGNRPQTNVNISIGDMHLDALRKVNSDMAANKVKTIDADYEDVTDE